MTTADRVHIVAAKLATLNRVAYTPEQLAAATQVRTAYGWFDVLRVNDQTVTVAADFWPYRIPNNVIMEVR